MKGKEKEQNGKPKTNFYFIYSSFIPIIPTLGLLFQHYSILILIISILFPLFQLLFPIFQPSRISLSLSLSLSFPFSLLLLFFFRSLLFLLSFSLLLLFSLFSFSLLPLLSFFFSLSLLSNRTTTSLFVPRSLIFSFSFFPSFLLPSPWFRSLTLTAKPDGHSPFSPLFFFFFLFSSPSSFLSFFSFFLSPFSPGSQQLTPHRTEGATSLLLPFFFLNFLSHLSPKLNTTTNPLFSPESPGFQPTDQRIFFLFSFNGYGAPDLTSSVASPPDPPPSPATTSQATASPPPCSRSPHDYTQPGHAQTQTDAALYIMRDHAHAPLLLRRLPRLLADHHLRSDRTHARAKENAGAIRGENGRRTGEAS